MIESFEIIARKTEDGLIRVLERKQTTIPLFNGKYIKHIVRGFDKISELYNKDNKFIGVDVFKVEPYQVEVVYNRPKRETIVIIADKNGDKFKGVSKCHPEDKFDSQRGFEIARARAEIKRYQAEIRKQSRGE